VVGPGALAGSAIVTALNRGPVLPSGSLTPTLVRKMTWLKRVLGGLCCLFCGYGRLPGKARSLQKQAPRAFSDSIVAGDAFRSAVRAGPKGPFYPTKNTNTSGAGARPLRRLPTASGPPNAIVQSLIPAATEMILYRENPATGRARVGGGQQLYDNFPFPPLMSRRPAGVPGGCTTRA